MYVGAIGKGLIPWFGCRRRWRRGTRGDYACGQQHDDEHDDGDDDDDHRDQLHVLPPVGAGHLLRRVLKVLRLCRNTGEDD